MTTLDAILYINLAHRHDRAAHVLHEIAKICNDPCRVHRIDAIQRTPGALGCGLSHIKALQFALDHPEWQTILVLEDDFTFHDGMDLRSTIDALMRFSPHIDIGLLSYNREKFQGIPTMRHGIHKVMYSQTTSSYIIRRSYIPILMQNMKEAMYDMERTGWSESNCIDIHWTHLQLLGNWYATVPALGYQYENYSDIEQRVTAYGC